MGLAASWPALAADAGDENRVTKMTITKRAMHKVGFKWSKVEGADRYVMRVVRPSGKLVLKKRTKRNKAMAKHLRPGRTYRFRVKARVGGQFGPYKTRRVKTKNEGVSSIELFECPAASCVGEDTYEKSQEVCWNAKGYSEMGFKLVWSKNGGPEYPTRSGDMYNYYSHPKTERGTVYGFDGSGDYYVRVCEYLGGKCGVYSNQIKVGLD